MTQYAHCVINAMQVQVIEERPESFDLSRYGFHDPAGSAIGQQRLATTAAYANLVDERIAERRETHAGDSQRLGVFIKRRFRPSVRYCAVIPERLAQLAVPACIPVTLAVVWHSRRKIRDTA